MVQAVQIVQAVQRVTRFKVSSSRLSSNDMTYLGYILFAAFIFVIR